MTVSKTIDTPLPLDFTDSLSHLAGHELGIDLFNSGSFQPSIEGNQHKIKWKNGNFPILVTAAYIVILNDINCYMDTWASLTAKPLGSLIHKMVWDKYSNASDTHGVWIPCETVVPQQGRIDFDFMALPIGRKCIPSVKFPDGINYTIDYFAVHFGAAIKFRYLNI